MFDRRVKIFLSVLIVFTLVLICRAVQLQVVERSFWANKAVEMMSTGDLVETTRGKLLDRKGRVIAEDAPCTDACVYFQAIPREPDADWVKARAKDRLVNRLGGDYIHADKAQRETLLAAEIDAVRNDIDAMWNKLAELGKMSREEMDDRRQAVVRKVWARRRQVMYARYQKALRDLDNREPSPWYQNWLMDDSADTPELDEFAITVGEQTAAHVILPAISDEVRNFLDKNRDKYPGLKLQRGTHRYYRYGDAAAHVIGHLSYVMAEDRKSDPNKTDELRRYYDNDLIGRTGLEALCEPLLRGVRGKVERTTGENGTIRTNIPAVAGKDVHTTIDIELQKEIQEIFTHIPFRADTDFPWTDTLRMLGAAVVIDVQTGEVIALVSYPTYDLNRFDEDYAELAGNMVEFPMLNRATQVALEPGSTVKPMVGLGAITSGIVSPDVKIECTGYLTINGHTYYNVARCWVASMYESRFGRSGVAHHPFPYPHPDGFLTYPDALERSCNVFFETLADRMGMEELRKWYSRFGLGRPTGIGIAEVKGEIPLDRSIPAVMRAPATWFSGIGQSQVRATPIQMANVVATVARDGIWMRPRLVPDGTLPPSTNPTENPDRVDLQLSRAALAEAKQGMHAVVYGAAGTGVLRDLDKLGVEIAGKTGSAQAAPLRLPRVDPLTGKVVTTTFDVPVEDKQTGQVRVETRTREVWDPVEIGTHEHPNPTAPWYRGTGSDQNHISHAWYTAFAPADHPKVAVAAMVQYGGSGGAAAGYVVREVLERLVQHGYLAKQ
jgi:penicillin-binding protein 2